MNRKITASEIDEKIRICIECKASPAACDNVLQRREHCEYFRRYPMANKECKPFTFEVRKSVGIKQKEQWDGFFEMNKQLSQYMKKHNIRLVEQ